METEEHKGYLKEEKNKNKHRGREKQIQSGMVRPQSRPER